jgi:hypothetical protein
MGTSRSLPPGAAARSQSVTARPRAASSMALTKPPTPAPMTITRLLGRLIDLGTAIEGNPLTRSA